MGALVRRAAFSLVVSEGGDYSGTISDREGNLVASGVTDLAAHLGHDPVHGQGHARTGSASRPRSTSDPATSCSSTTPTSVAPTTTTCGRSCPCTSMGGSPRSSRTRCTGRTSAVTCPARSTRTRAPSYGEGLAVPPVHIVREGVFVGEMADIILRNIRLAEQARGDLLTMIGAVRLGERRMQELAAHYGAGHDRVGDGRAHRLLGAAPAGGVPATAGRDPGPSRR